MVLCYYPLTCTGYGWQLHHVAMSVKFDPEYDPHLDDMKLMQHDVFSTVESKQALRT